MDLKNRYSSTFVCEYEDSAAVVPLSRDFAREEAKIIIPSRIPLETGFFDRILGLDDFLFIEVASSGVGYPQFLWITLLINSLFHFLMT